MMDLGPSATGSQHDPDDDPLRAIEDEIRQSVTDPARDELELPDLFDETAYLDAFPDVLTAIRRGDVASASDHYLRHGEREKRLNSSRYRLALAGAETDDFPAHGLDAVFVTHSGRMFVIGWIDDQNEPLHQVSLLCGKDNLGATGAIARCRRPDADELMKPPPGTMLGFWTLLRAEHWRGSGGPSPAIALAAGRHRKRIAVQPTPVNEQRLRELCLEYLASALYCGNPQVEGALQLDSGLGADIIDLNVRISERIKRRGVYSKRFGQQRARYRGSVVVCLYGKPEFVFLQASLFSVGGDWSDYEFIYVVNSPEIAEALLKEATLAARVYDVSITVVVLSANAGFGAANNIAVEHARSTRILICNPDVFPRQTGLGRRHAEMIDQLPPDQTRIFGVPLFYDDGSLMHGGMFFERDEGVSIQHSGIARHTLIRVEHFGKGAPPDTLAFTQARRVPAVTGAFISVEREWFEQLGGFSLQYVFGHYEDADLCLKSLSADQPVWLQPLPFWHLEGKGSNRRQVHEGGSLVNRWHFSQCWNALIENGVEGRTPERLRTPVPPARRAKRLAG